MSDWTIGLVPPPGGRGFWIVDALNAQLAWKRLSKPAQAAVEAAHRNGLVDAHVNTMAALERHGFMHSDCRLTEAGKAVAKWCVSDG